MFLVKYVINHLEKVITNWENSLKIRLILVTKIVLHDADWITRTPSLYTSDYGKSDLR